jgi:D-3-phosphoglycerate dehydrogenase / 2-oxoglutarate reductase
MGIIFSTHPLHPDVSARIEAAGQYRVASSPTAAAIMAEGLDAAVLIVRANIPPEYFTSAPLLRGAVRHGAGLDMIPMQAANDTGVLVANVPGANAGTVAEHAIFAAIALRRQFRAMDIALRTQGWNAGRAYSDHGRDLSGTTLGVLGMGNIGRALTQMAQAGFGMKVISHTRRPERLPKGVRAVSLDDLVSQSDVLVLCCPLTEETRGVISATRIAMMHKGAVLINVARGPVVDTAALTAALQERRILGAALDVFDHQPLPESSPLYALDNVILTPHMAGVTQDSMLRVGTIAADEVIVILSNRLPHNFCNSEVTASYRKRFPAS